MKPFLAFLFPLAIYLLILGIINRRRRPLIVPGAWDFAGVLFASSGFLLVGGPAILNTLRERWQISALLNQRRSAQGMPAEGFWFWMFLSILYFAVVVLASVMLLRRRRGQLAVYNVEPAVLDEALAHALDRLGLSWTRSGAHVCIGYAVSPVEHPGRMAGMPPADVEYLGYAARLEVEAFTLLRHVTISFHQVDPPLRQELESELNQVLGQVSTRDNPLGVCFLLLALGLFGLTFLLALLVIILPVIARG